MQHVVYIVSMTILSMNAASSIQTLLEILFSMFAYKD